MTDLRKVIAKRLTELREKHGLSQEELGDAAGVSRVTIYKIESGRVGTNIDILAALALQLDVKPAELLQEEPAQSKAEKPFTRAQSELLKALPKMTDDEAETFLRLFKIGRGIDVANEASSGKSGKKIG